MLRNYLKVALRNISKQKLFSAISIGGLAIGMACCLLLFIYIQLETSFDKFHENADHIYRMTTTHVFEGREFSRFQTPLPLGPALKNEFPEVKNHVRFVGFWPDVKHGDKLFKEERNFYTESSLFEVFSFELIKGNPKTVLSEPFTVVINEHIAEKYFGQEEPLNKTLIMNDKPYRVTGILKNIPLNSHLTFNLLASLPSLQAEFEGKNDDSFSNWRRTNYSTYIELNEGISKAAVEEKMPAIIEKYLGKRSLSTTFYHLQPLRDIHLHSDFRYDIAVRGNPNTIIILSAVAFFILLMACINHLNLSVGMSSIRYKEIGVRKVIGADKAQIFKQFLGEASVICLLAIVLGIGIAEILLPKFNEIVFRSIRFDYSFPMISTLLGLVLITCFVAGSIPALAMSKLKAVQIFRGSFKLGGPNTFTKLLVSLQFSFSIFFLLSTILIAHQLDFIKSRHLTFDKDEIQGIPLYSLFRRYPDREERYRMIGVFQNELNKNPNIISSTTTSFHFGYEGGMSAENLMINGKRTQASLSFVDTGYLETFNIKLLRGRDFSRDNASDRRAAILINETLAEQFADEDPIGQKFDVWDQKCTIIGITEDFHLNTVHEKIPPLILKASNSPQFLLIKLKAENRDETLKFISARWSKLFPGIPLNYSFLRDELDKRYASENKLKQVLKYSSFFAVWLSVLGVIGLTALSITRRTREIGIRKVLGATVKDVIGLISRDFIKLVAYGNIVAWPVAYIVIKSWLENFVYRTEINIWPFFISGMTVLLLTVITLSFQSLRSARANPVDVLRWE